MADLNEVIPTIDLKEIPSKMLNQKIREAGERWGCFKVINHGVSLSLMTEMKKIVTDLHERPTEVKWRNTDVLCGGGYAPQRELHPFHESFGLFDMASPQAVTTFCDQVEASAHQREIMVKYGKTMDDLAWDIVRRIGESYGLVETDFFKKSPNQVRLSKYHFKPETIGKLGLPIHTDPGFLTVSQGDNDVGGLEAMDPSSGTFFPINTFPNTLTVNFGDLATIWSNGRLCSVKHRVHCKEAKMRISISTFVLGPLDRDLETPSDFVDAEHPRLYKPISYGELRNIKMNNNILDDECLKFITI